MRVNIFQVLPDKDARGVRFSSFDDTQKQGGVHPEEYRCVFRGDVDCKNLDEVYMAFNDPNYCPHDLQTNQGHALTPSDVVQIIGDIPNIYGKIDFLFETKGEETVGDTLYFTSKDEFDKAISEAKDNLVNIKPQIYSDEPHHLVTEGCYYCDRVGWRQIEFDTAQCEDMKGVRVLMLIPGRKPVVTRLEDKLSALQRAVSRHGEESLIEVTHPFDDYSVGVLGNEEAKLIEMEGNRHINGSVYAGPIYITNENDDGEFIDLTDEQIAKYDKMFATPEDISQEEVQADCGFFISMF